MIVKRNEGSFPAEEAPLCVSMLCDVSCDDDKMQNVGTVAVGVLAWWLTDLQSPHLDACLDI